MPEETQELALTKRENEILAELLNPANQIEAAIPVDIDHRTLWNYLQTACKAAGRFRMALERIQPVIGRILIVVQDNPSFYKNRDCATFDQFITEKVRGELGLSRTDAYEAMRLVKKWPSLTVERFARIGKTKMNLISRVTDESSTGHGKWLNRAEKMPLRELKAEIVKAGLLDKGEMEATAIIIPCSQALADQWRLFAATPEVQAVCESDKQSIILERMMQEVSSEWLQPRKRRASGG